MEKNYIAFYRAVLFLNSVYGGDYSVAVLSAMEQPEKLLQLIRCTAVEYGCTAPHSSAVEECFYLFKDAEKAVSAILG